MEIILSQRCFYGWGETLYSYDIETRQISFRAREKSLVKVRGWFFTKKKDLHDGVIIYAIKGIEDLFIVLDGSTYRYFEDSIRVEMATKFWTNKITFISESEIIFSYQYRKLLMPELFGHHIFEGEQDHFEYLQKILSNKESVMRLIKFFQADSYAEL